MQQYKQDMEEERKRMAAEEERKRVERERDAQKLARQIEIDDANNKIKNLQTEIENADKRLEAAYR